MTLKVKDVAKAFCISEKTVYRWIKQGSIPVYQVHDQYRFNRAELLEWATRNRVDASPALLDEVESRGTEAGDLSAALRRGVILYRVAGDTRTEAITNVVRLIPLPEETNRPRFLEALLLREELASTGIGHGIAIPHVRGPIILPVSQSTVSLCFLDHPVDFNALDGEPVSVLFVVVSPTVRGHLQLLSRLSYALQDQSLRDLLSQQGPREEIIGAFETIDRRVSDRPATCR